MFDKPKNQTQDPIDVPLQEASMSKPAKKEFTFKVHAMPQRLHTQKHKSAFDKPEGQKGKDKGKLILIVVSAVVVVGLGVIGYLILRQRASLANANGNENENTNISLNFNFNSNRGTNLNSPDNANANSNAINAANTNTSSNRTFAGVPSSEDIDNDQLTNVEETTYSTSPSTADTDSDGFSDGTEVLFGYSPLDKTKLADASVISKYTNAPFGFTLLYPREWTVQRRGTDDKGLLLISPEGDEFVEVTVVDNIGRLTPRQWYLEQVGASVNEASITSIENWKKDATAVRSVDGFSAHYGFGNYIYTLYYETSSKSQLDYKTTFETIVKSIEFVVPSGPTNTNTNANANTNTNQGTINIHLNTNTNSNTNSASNQNTNTNTNTNTNANSNTNGS